MAIIQETEIKNTHHRPIEKDEVAWFDEYAAVFTRLASAGILDSSQLLPYFSLPVRMADEHGCIVLPDTDSLAMVLTGQLRSLRDLKYGASKAIRKVVHQMSQRSAIIDVTWIRYDNNGTEFQRMRVFYIIEKPDDVWCMTSLSFSSV